MKLQKARILRAFFFCQKGVDTILILLTRVSTILFYIVFYSRNSRNMKKVGNSILLNEICLLVF